MAKKLLMSDNNSDDEETLIKQELVDNEAKESKVNSKTKKPMVKIDDSKDLMLTADKMMNKELNLLHAPVLSDEAKETLSNGPVTRNKQVIKCSVILF